MHHDQHPQSRQPRRSSPGSGPTAGRTTGPAPIGDFLPKLRLRVRTIPTLVWRDGAWQVEWIVIHYHELVHVRDTRMAAPTTRRMS